MTARRSSASARTALFALVCLALLLAPAEGPAGATDSERTPPSVTAIVVETTPDALTEAEAALGFSLDATRGRCVLTADEHAVLLGAITGEARGRVVGQGTVLITPGADTFHKSVERIRLQHCHEPRTDPASLLAPEELAEREVGFVFDPHCLGERADGLLPMAPLISVSRLTGWHKVAPGITEPVIKEWRLHTRLNAPLGKTIVFINRPREPFDSSALFPTGKPAPPSVAVILLRVE